jgi:redox-regulated HSP33 family molecular chaperone
MTSRGDDDAFVPINPQTLNWEKIGPDQDVFVSALSQNGHVNVKVISAKNMVQEMKDKRGLSTVATELMGRVMLSAILVANGIKDQETLQLTFSGDGTAKGVMAISDGACNVRAWIGNPELGEELRDPTTGKANIRAAVGQGTLQVVKNHPSWRIPYNGVVKIASGEVGPDVAFYLASSEQRNTAIGVGLHMDPTTGKVESAGGFYIEMMPGVEEESITKVSVVVCLCVCMRLFGWLVNWMCIYIFTPHSRPYIHTHTHAHTHTHKGRGQSGRDQGTIPKLGPWPVVCGGEASDTCHAGEIVVE